MNPFTVTKFKELCIAVKFLNSFTFNTRLRLYLIENPSNRFVLRIKSLITFSKISLTGVVGIMLTCS